jgi:predicted dehydrogenase
MIEQQLAGKLLLAQVNCFWSRDEHYYANSNWHGRSAFDGGVLFTQFSHIIDFLNWLYKDLQPVDAVIRQLVHFPGKDIPETGVVRFDAGKNGIITLSFTTAVAGGNLDNSITVMGDKGTIKLSGQYFEKLECHNIHHQFSTDAMPHDNRDNLRALYDSVITQVQAGAPNYENLASACRTVEIIEKIHNMAAVEEWPLEMLVRSK